MIVKMILTIPPIHIEKNPDYISCCRLSLWWRIDLQGSGHDILKWKHRDCKAETVEEVAFKEDFQTNTHVLPQLIDKIGHAEKKEFSGLTNIFLDCKREVGVGGNEDKKIILTLKNFKMLGNPRKNPAGADIKLE